MSIRPVSDLRNHLQEIEESVRGGSPVFLTKNGSVSMVLMDLEQFACLTDNIDLLLFQADAFAKEHEERFSHEEVFDDLRNYLNDK